MFIPPLAQFVDRKDAGRQLAVALTAYRGSDSLLCPIVCGGVIVADEIAQQLKLPVEPLFIGKFGYPFDSELSYGAVSADSEVITLDNIDPNWVDWVNEQVRTKQTEAVLRRDRYTRAGATRLLGDAKVIIVDDAVATGVSIELAIRSVRNRGASSVIVAVPRMPLEIRQRFRSLVDDIVTLDRNPPTHGNDQLLYLNFPEVSYDEVLDVLHRRQSG